MKHTTPLLVVALAVLAPSVARADAYFEFGAGLVLPVSDDDYTDFVDPSVGLAARIGGGGDVGGMFSVEWAPLSSDPDNFTFNRFRLLGHLVLHHRLNAKTQLVGRIGAGVDILHSNFDATIFGVRVEDSDSDVGLALEAAGGVWFRIGRGSTEIGVEMALPISYHDNDGPAVFDPEDQEFEYTAFDIEILGGVRLRL
jgi:hypothetical protein